MVPSRISALASRDRQLVDQLLVLVEHARHVGEEEQARGLQRTGDGAGEGVGVDVVGMAVAAGRHRRDAPGSSPSAPEGRAACGRPRPARRRSRDRAPARYWNPDRVIVFCAFSANTMLPSLPHSPIAHSPSALISATISLLIEPASTISTISTVFWSVTRRPPSNSRFDAHLGQHRADLRAAAMHDDRVDAGLLEQRDVAGEGLAERGVAHGMAAIFHHDRLVLVALHVGQRRGQQARLLRRRWKCPSASAWPSVKWNGGLLSCSDGGRNAKPGRLALRVLRSRRRPQERLIFLATVAIQTAIP